MIAAYEDWPDAVRAAEPYVGTESVTALARVLGLRRLGEAPTVIDEGAQELDGVVIRRLRWSVGYGPDTTAWLLRPADVAGRLPGVLGLHCHGGIRSVGGEQLVDVGPDASPRPGWLRDLCYYGLAPANDLARRGFAVLVHDTFSWGSRRFDLSGPTPRLAALLEAQEALWRQQGVTPTDDERFDIVSRWHEDTVAKAAGTIGQTFAGAVLTDDLVALRVLARRRESTHPARHVRLLGRRRPEPAAGGSGRSARRLRGQLHDGHLRLARARRAGYPLVAVARAGAVVADRTGRT